MEMNQVLLNLNEILRYPITTIKYIIEEVFFINGNFIIIYTI